MTNSVQREQFVDWARDRARPLLGVEPSADESDLAYLGTTIGEARIVGIGESWHSTHELLSLKGRLVRYLIEHRGFKAVLFEGSLPGSEKLNGCLLGNGGTVEELLRSFGQPMWLNPETTSLLRWIEAFNARQPQPGKVQVFGIDAVYPSAAIASVLNYFERVDPGNPFPEHELLQRVRDAFAQVRLDSEAPSAIWGAAEVYGALSDREREQVQSAFVNAVGKLEQCQSTYCSRSSPVEFEWTLRQAVVVLQAWTILCARLQSATDANEARALALAENATWMINRLPEDTRIVIFAHNLHIAKEPFRAGADDRPLKSVGGYLTEWFGNDYMAIGTSVGVGRLRGSPGLVGASASDHSDAASFLPDSIDAALGDVGLEHFMLDLRELRGSDNNADWIAQRRAMRAHVDPKPEYVAAQAFDIVCYVDHISRAALLPRVG